MGREMKHFRLEREAYQAKLNKAVEWHRPNARELYELLRQTKTQAGGRFMVEEWNKPVILQLCLYFAGDPKCEEYGLSLEKGIAIIGPSGTGKTHLMTFFQKNPVQSYLNVTCSLVAERFRTGWKRNEQDTLEYYVGPAKAEFGHVYGHTELGYCFGDLGTEGEKKNYGNTVNVMEHILFQRYENKLPFNQTHITTNLNADEIKERYGERIRDRFREMFNQVALVGPSWR